jgi:hypothetical protein
VGTMPALVAAVALLVGATDAYAQRKITRLGNPATRLTAPIKDTAALQKTFTNKRNQTAISQALDKAGLTSITPQVIAALTEGKVTATSVAPGTPLQWMALRRAGKVDLATGAVWAGTKPFDAFAFSVEEGVKIYNFVVPKACGNMSLANVTEKPLPGCVNVAVARDCNTKQATFSASGAAITGNTVTKVAVMRDGARVGEMLPGGGFKLALPVQAGRYTFMATDQYGREFGTCERDLTVEACAAPPPPPPPPPPTSCGATLTAVAAKGGWNMTVDPAASGTGGSPAAKAMVQMIGPDGKPVPFSYQGKSQTEVELVAPFQQATFFVPKAKPGTYTVRASVTPVNPKAELRSCEATVVVPEYDKIDWFADGTFGKQRRQYDLESSEGVGISPGFCDPQLAFKAGPLFWFADYRASFAPALGLAFQFGGLDDLDFDPNEYNNVSVLAEAVINYHFSPRGAFIGTGFGWWDLFDTDHNTGAWIVNFGAPVSDSDKGTLLFIGEGRLFFANNDQGSNYNLMAGMRYIFK